jgi:acetylornithine deacetylase
MAALVRSDSHHHRTDAIENLRALVAFDTTSRNSNLALIDWVEETVLALGGKTQRLIDEAGEKANLIVSFGPIDVPGGIVLSGHTDVVPVDGQPWTTDPWVLHEADGKLYGRGTCDMKGFSACLLALAPAMAAAPLKKPIHWALSYDEEVGCIGAPPMVQALVDQFAPIDAVFIGEPSNMKVMSGQKSITTFAVEVTGREAHSSQIDQGVSAIMEALPLMQAVADIADRLRREAPCDSLFHPPGTTITIGKVEGGTAVNILARHCKFVFDVRAEPDVDPHFILKELQPLVDTLDASIKARAPEGGATLTWTTHTLPMAPQAESLAEQLARSFTGDNTMRTVAYGTEGGIFQKAGLSTVICGPGSIDQAHQPDEFIEISELDRCLHFVEKVIARQSA